MGCTDLYTIIRRLTNVTLHTAQYLARTLYHNIHEIRAILSIAHQPLVRRENRSNLICLVNMLWCYQHAQRWTFDVLISLQLFKSVLWVWGLNSKRWWWLKARRSSTTEVETTRLPSTSHGDRTLYRTLGFRERHLLLWNLCSCSVTRANRRCRTNSSCTRAFSCNSCCCLSREAAISSLCNGLPKTSFKPLTHTELLESKRAW